MITRCVFRWWCGCTGTLSLCRRYLAGALFPPDTYFPGTNMTAAQHYAKGRRFVQRWLDRRYKWGFQEFKSETYLEFDVANLANVVAMAPAFDPYTAVRAAMVLDLVLTDLVTHAHKGMIASARGRSCECCMSAQRWAAQCGGVSVTRCAGACVCVAFRRAQQVQRVEAGRRYHRVDAWWAGPPVPT